jgi:hypothetical protein
MALEDATNPMQGVSGPGRYARRTDLQYSPDTQGAGVAMAQQKAGAPLEKAGGVKLSQAPNVSTTQEPAVGLYDQTQRPNEPIGHGVDNVAGGAGSEALMMRKPDDTNFRSAIQSAKPVLSYIADLPDTSPETRQAIRQLWDMQ